MHRPWARSGRRRELGLRPAPLAPSAQRIVAENNDRAQYNIVLEDRADDIILERGQRNGQLFDAYFANPAIRRVFIDYLASTYDEFRSAAR